MTDLVFKIVITATSNKLIVVECNKSFMVMHFFVVVHTQPPVVSLLCNPDLG